MPTCFRYTDYAILNRAKKKKRVMVLTKSKCSLDCSPKIELVIDIRRWTSALNQNEQLKWGFQVVGKAYICRVFTKLAISVLLVVLVSLRFFYIRAHFQNVYWDARLFARRKVPRACFLFLKMYCVFV